MIQKQDVTQKRNATLCYASLTLELMSRYDFQFMVQYVVWYRKPPERLPGVRAFVHLLTGGPEKYANPPTHRSNQIF